MGKTATNIFIVLGIATVAFVGYYFYSQGSLGEPAAITSDEIRQNMLNNTRIFQEYRKTLNTLKLDTSIFTDSRFTSLRSFTTEIIPSRIGRDNPFVEVNNRVNPEPESLWIP